METLTGVEDCVDRVLARVGKRVWIATPLGLGKPNHLLNAFYRRARADASLDLRFYTALTLERPKPKSDLERRFLTPLAERVFGNYPDLDYELDRGAGRLPANVRVIEFYFPAGKLLHNQLAQRDYTSTNYTHVARDLAAEGVNVIAQLVCAGVVEGRPRLSLSCNADVSLDLMRKLRPDRRDDGGCVFAAQINDQLPFMYGEADVAPETFDYVIDDPAQSYTLFAPPKVAVDAAETMIGLYASTLVKDGGEIQVGIGALGDAVVYGLMLRHQDNASYQQALRAFDVRARFADVIARIGDTGTFREGLFAASEMLVDGFMPLFEAGILKRKIYDDVALSRLLNEGRIGEQITPDLLELLRARKAIHSVLDEADFAYLQHFGILRGDLRWEQGRVALPDGRHVVPDLADPQALGLLQAHMGTTLDHGAVIHAAFFVGPAAFYEWLRNLPEAQRRLIDMRSVTRINQLYGHEEIGRLHRRHARFVNTTMAVTLLGAAASDTLESGAVVSGVGGQYNFVAMAHELPDGRSLLQVRSTREHRGELRSNLVWSHGQVTIPRHLRDVVITEYGIADLRGRTDEECIAALLNVADSRFQDTLLREATRSGKLRPDHVIPDAHRANLPERYEQPLVALRARGLFPAYPFGTDLTPDEQRLARALRALKSSTATRAGRLRALASAALHGTATAELEPLLRRMDLHAPRSARERLYRRLVAAALAGAV
jgi:acyl-CoA hydrolase